MDASFISNEAKKAYDHANWGFKWFVMKNGFYKEMGCMYKMVCMIPTSFFILINGIAYEINNWVV